MSAPAPFCLKVDVCTHDGMRDGVPRLLDLFERLHVRASFFLSFGPDNSGKAVLQAFRPSFLRKMLKTSAPSLYGWRTVLSGTLLPARPIASGHPDLVRRIDAAGHEIAVHAWDHRRWQDHLETMDERAIESQFERAWNSYESILGRAPRASGAAAWAVSPTSLRIQDALGLDYASDLRGGPVCRLRAGGRVMKTPQVPTTGRCIEELLTDGVRDADAMHAALLADLESESVPVLAVHAELEGGPYLSFCERLVRDLLERHGSARTLAEAARTLRPEQLPVREFARVPCVGRSGLVSSSIGSST